MRIPLLTVIIGLVVAAAALAEPQTNNVEGRAADLSRQYEDMAARVNKETGRALYALSDRYRAALKRREGALVSEGDIVWLPLLREEISRFEKKKALPEQANAALDAETLNIQRAFLGMREQINTDRARKLAFIERWRVGRQGGANGPSDVLRGESGSEEIGGTKKTSGTTPPQAVLQPADRDTFSPARWVRVPKTFGSNETAVGSSR